jgi:hypothetical protein
MQSGFSYMRMREDASPQQLQMQQLLHLQEMQHKALMSPQSPQQQQQQQQVPLQVQNSTTLVPYVPQVQTQMQGVGHMALVPYYTEQLRQQEAIEREAAQAAVREAAVREFVPSPYPAAVPDGDRVPAARPIQVDNQLTAVQLRTSLREREERKRCSFATALERAYSRVRRCSLVGRTDCVFEVPAVVVGQPLYDVPRCVDFVLRHLAKNGFHVLHDGDRTLHIAWTAEMPALWREATAAKARAKAQEEAAQAAARHAARERVEARTQAVRVQAPELNSFNGPPMWHSTTLPHGASASGRAKGAIVHERGATRGDGLTTLSQSHDNARLPAFMQYAPQISGDAAKGKRGGRRARSIADF